MHGKSQRRQYIVSTWGLLIATYPSTLRLSADEIVLASIFTYTLGSDQFCSSSKLSKLDENRRDSK